MAKLHIECEPSWVKKVITLLSTKLRIQLVDEAFGSRRRGLDLRIEIGCWLGGDDLLRRLALLDHLAHAVANGEHDIAVRDHGGAIHGNAVARNDFRIRT